MTDIYMDNSSGSRKKYLVPLVVLLLCAVSLTGAGYAYSSMVSQDGDVTEDAVIIAINDNDGQSLDFEVDWKSVTRNGSTVWTIEDAVTYEFTMGYVKTESTVYDGKVLVSIGVMPFAYTLTIGEKSVDVAAGTAVSNEEFVLGEGIHSTECSISIAEGAATTFNGNTSVPADVVEFTIQAETVETVPVEDESDEELPVEA